ncbi:MAG TPA: hypothetical protein VFX16_10185 [Pseudonocardiaceae bacterium]|nr:hypothetical protein [Pseudonocardiaceae bacterium]
MTMARSSPAWTGWVVFAALMLAIIGVLNVIEGIVGLIYGTRTVVIASDLYVVDIRGWSFVLLVFGAILVAAGIGLCSRKTWARIAAIVAVSLHAIAQVGWLGAYPVWSLLMLGLDIVVLFALTARWERMDLGMDDVTGVSSWDERYSEPRTPR